MKFPLNRIIATIALAGICLSHPATAAILTKGKNVKVMPVGDSITLGKDGCLGGYRRPLYEWLIANGYAITYVGKENRLDIRRDYPITCSDGSTPYHEGYGGFRTDMILNGGTAERRIAPPLKTTLETFKPDVVLLMLGTNDIIQAWQLETLEARLEQILETIYAANPKTSVLVASIAPIKRPAWAEKEARVLAYNAAIPGILEKQKALGRQVAFVDVHETLSSGGLSGDGVHPGDLGYAKIAQAFYKELTGETPPVIDRKNPLLLPPPLPQSSATPAAANASPSPAAKQ